MFSFYLFLGFIKGKKYDACLGKTFDDEQTCKNFENSLFINISEMEKNLNDFKDESLSIYVAADSVNDRELEINFDCLQKLTNFEIKSKKENIPVLIKCEKYSCQDLNSMSFENVCVSFNFSHKLSYLKVRKTRFIDYGLYSDFLDSDLYSMETCFMSTASSVDIDISDGISENCKLEITNSKLRLKKISENINILFSSTKIIVESADTHKNISFEVPAYGSECIISDFMKPNLNIAISGLFVSSIFVKYDFKLYLDQPSNLIMDQTSWEGSDFKTFDIYQCSDSNITVYCNILRMKFMFENSSNTNLILRSKNVLFESRLNICNAKLNVCSYNTNGIVNMTACYLYSQGNSSVFFDQNIVCMINSLLLSGDNNDNTSIIGTTSYKSIMCEKGSLYISDFNSSIPCVINVIKPNSSLVIGNHITNCINNKVRIVYRESVDDVLFYSGCAFHVANTDNCSSYKVVIDRNSFFTDNSIVQLSYNISQPTDNCFMIITNATRISDFKDMVSTICVVENTSFVDKYPWVYRTYMQNDLTNQSIQYTFGKYLSIFIAGNITVPIRGISTIYEKVSFIGLTPNASLTIDESLFDSMILSNVTLVHSPKKADESLTAFSFRFNCSFIKSNSIIKSQFAIMNFEELKEMHGLFSCDMLIITTEACNLTVSAYDSYLAFHGFNISTANCAKISFSPKNFNDSILNLYVYGNSVAKISIFKILIVNLYCYNKSCTIKFSSKQQLFIHSELVPDFIDLPSKVTFVAPGPIFRLKRINIMGTCEITSDAPVQVDCPILCLTSSNNLIIRNIVFNLTLINIKKSFTYIELKAIRLQTIIIDPYSFVFLDNSCHCKNLTVGIKYFTGSVPFLGMKYNIDNVNINMINVASNNQLYSKELWSDVKTLVLRVSNMSSFSIRYISKSWAFNEDTREFNVIKESLNDLSWFYIVKRVDDIVPTNSTSNKNGSRALILIVSISIVSFVIFIVCIIFIIKCIKKKKINEYVSSVASDQLISVI